MDILSSFSFEETTAQITVLAVFLPVAAGQSGITGSQALAATLRGLAVREVRVRHWLQSFMSFLGLATVFSTFLTIT